MLSESELLSRFRGVRPCGDGWTAHCPAHEDRRQSLTVGRGDKGWVLNCHRGCEFGDIIASTTPPTDARELFPETNGNAAAGRREVAVYDYGTYQVVRFEPKHFLQRRPDGKGGYIWNLKGVKPRLYHLDALKGREVVYVVEGEKDADRLWLLNIPATCNSGGAAVAAAARKKWKPTHTEQLVKAGVENVVVIPDADQPGQDHAENVARACAAAGLAVKLVALPEGAMDISDYLDGGGTAEALGALVKQTPVYEPAVPCFVRATDVHPAAVKWLWEPYLPLGHPTTLAGDPGAGKSMIALALVAAGSRGAPLPGGGQSEPWSTLWLGLEDDLPAVVVPRFMRMGGDPDRLFCYQPEAGADLDEAFVAAAVELSERIKARFVVLDSVLAWRPGDVNDGAYIRQIVRLLSPLCVNRSLMLICHNRKAGATAAIHRVAGSMQFSAAVRSVLTVHADGDDTRVLAHAKSNFGALGESRQFSIVDPGRLVWGNVDARSADELSASASDCSNRTERQEAEDFLRELLADGPVASTEVYKAARANGISEPTLRRAKTGLVVSHKAGFGGGWKWSLSTKVITKVITPESDHLRDHLRKNDDISRF